MQLGHSLISKKVFVFLNCSLFKLRLKLRTRIICNFILFHFIFFLSFASSCRIQFMGRNNGLKGGRQRFILQCLFYDFLYCNIKVLQNVVVLKTKQIVQTSVGRSTSNMRLASKVIGKQIVLDFLPKWYVAGCL